MGFLVSPFVSPFLFGFLCARARYVVAKILSYHELMHRAVQLAVGIRHRLDIQRRCRLFHCVLRRGDVRIKPRFWM